MNTKMIGRIIVVITIFIFAATSVFAITPVNTVKTTDKMAGQPIDVSKSNASSAQDKVDLNNAVELQSITTKWVSPSSSNPNYKISVKEGANYTHQLILTNVATGKSQIIATTPYNEIFGGNYAVVKLGTTPYVVYDTITTYSYGKGGEYGRKTEYKTYIKNTLRPDIYTVINGIFGHVAVNSNGTLTIETLTYRTVSNLSKGNRLISIPSYSIINPAAKH